MSISFNDNYFRYFFIGIMVSLLSTIFVYNKVLSFIVLISIIAILLCFLFKKDLYSYFLYYIMFVSLSFEESYLFNKEWYGILHTEVFGLNIAFYLVIPLFIFSIVHFKDVFKSFKLRPNTLKVTALLCIAFLFSIIFGLINILFNNNNIRSLPGYISSYCSLIYFYGFTILFLVTSIYLITYFDKDLNIKKYILTLLVILGIDILFVTLFNISGNYDTFKIILIPATSFYLPFLCLIGFYSTNKKIKILSLCSFIPVFIATVYNSSGKSLLILIIIPILILYKYCLSLKNVNKKRFIIFVGLSIVLFFIIVNNVNFVFNKPSIFSEKADQLLSLFKIFDVNYLENLPASPKCRVLEFLNICIDYIHNPFQLILGKGFLGSFRDNYDFLKNVGNAFSISQISSGIYYLPHETFCRLFLFNGLFGIYIFMYISKLFLKNFHVNCWFSIGFLWFIFFYGYSFNLSILGCVFFVIGFIQIDNSIEVIADIAILDFMFEFGHRTYCNSFANSLNKYSSTFFMDYNSYYDFKTSTEHIKCCVNAKKVPSRNPLITRINLLYNIKKQIKHFYKYRFDKIIISSYEGITLFLIVPFLLCCTNNVYVFQHHQIDELDLSNLKKKIFILYSKYFKHIVVDVSIKNNLINEYGLNSENIFIYTIPLLKVQSDNQNDIGGKYKYYIALSNSNDENFATNIRDFEIKTKYFKNNNIQFIIKTKQYLENLENIKFVTGFLTDEEYNNYYYNSSIVIIPFPNTFKNRGSASIIDALSCKKIVISSAIPFAVAYSKRYPSLCKIYHNFDEFISLLNEDLMFNQKDYDKFIEDHNTISQDKLAKLIVED